MIGLNTLLKLPFSKEFLSGGVIAALPVRSERYAIVAFVDFGAYPMMFRIEIKTTGRERENGNRQLLN